MAMRSLMTRLAPRLHPRLARLKGGVLSDKEKAEENAFIKRKEKEKLEKLAQKQGKLQEDAHIDVEKPTLEGQAPTEEETSASQTKAIALAAGVVALASGIYWYATRPSAKKEDD